MITFLGDIALLNSKISSKYMLEGDYIANFEYVCSNNRKLRPSLGKINIISSNCDFKSIFGYNPIALNVANNHILDYGLEGFHDTLSSINEQGIATIGNNSYWYNNSTCIMAYTLFCGEYNGENIVQFYKDKVEKDIENAKSNGAKCIIVNMHWGIENYSLPNNEQKELGRWLIDKGVDIVVGHHPHCIQPIEEYKGRYIVYSLGNCIFPSFSLKCFYDENGESTVKYRFNWRRWNKKGLALIYDEINKKILRIDELYFNNNVLKCTCHGVSIRKYLLQNAVSKNFARIQFILRKYWLFLVSNCFVDGSIFDINALKRELKK